MPVLERRVHGQHVRVHCDEAATSAWDTTSMRSAQPAERIRGGTAPMRPWMEISDMTPRRSGSVSCRLSYTFSATLALVHASTARYTEEAMPDPTFSILRKRGSSHCFCSAIWGQGGREQIPHGIRATQPGAGAPRVASTPSRVHAMPEGALLRAGTPPCCTGQDKSQSAYLGRACWGYKRQLYGVPRCLLHRIDARCPHAASQPPAPPPGAIHTGAQRSDH